ncbi:RapZ C-terminal domain-containing protein [Bailinhaonella thermotolerans]|uniref:ATPase n=1 Tax=Bailinhaonella thermotolerans TaxID=1070861 RepID=A0A3A4AD37_9ACTN|nr:RNase adapter RapZ [Bailinhaonella thermotolerans]RJL23970.1 ATPase [Bailinhaonella thermotolerans]
MTHPAVEVISFGYGHADPPTADVLIDARRLFRNPHADPRMRELTGLDDAVRRHVLATPGIGAVVAATVTLGAELVTDLPPGARPVRIATGCAGGRHRSVALAEAISAGLRDRGVAATLSHRDITKPIIQP